MFFTHVNQFEEFLTTGMLLLGSYFPDFDASFDDISTAQSFIARKVINSVGQSKIAKGIFVNALPKESVQIA